MSTKENRIVAGTILLLITAIAWGGMYPVAKSLLISIDAFYMSTIRYTVASLVYVVLLILYEGIGALSLQGKGITIFTRGSIGFIGFGIVNYSGLALSTPVHGAIIMAMMPLMTIIVAWISHGNKPNNITLGCVAMAFLGVFLVITRGNIQMLMSGGSSIIGDALMIIGNLCWVIYTLGARHVPHWSWLRYTTLTTVLGTVSILIVTIAATLMDYAHLPTLATVASMRLELSYVVVIATIIATLGWHFGIRNLGHVNGVLFMNLIPIVTLIIEILRGHHFPIIEYIGAGIVIFALVINYFNLRRVT